MEETANGMFEKSKEDPLFPKASVTHGYVTFEESVYYNSPGRG